MQDLREDTMTPTMIAETAESMKTEDYIAIEDRYGAHNYHPLDVVIQRAEGA
jgi:ornithine--oxo-acid transaminase